MKLNVNEIPKRIIAALIDLGIWLFLFIIAANQFGTKEVQTYHTATSAGANVHYDLTGIPALIFFLIEIAYYVGLEWKTGQTIGKMLMKIKVVNLDGKPITFSQSLIRNLLRIVDALPFIIPYLLGLIMIATNDKKQRLGDKVAKTLVVKA